MLEGVIIEQLRTLRAVAIAGSFTAAARKLGRVQAAVSQSIDRLEAQVGDRKRERLLAHSRPQVSILILVNEPAGARRTGEAARRSARSQFLFW